MTMEMPNLVPVLPEIVVLAMTCLILVVDLFLRDDQRDVTYLLTQATLVVAFALTWALGDDQVRLTLFGSVVNDPLSDVLKLFIYLLTFMTFVFARPYMKERGLHTGEYYVLGLLGVLGMMVMVSSYSMLLMYLGLELLSLSLYALVSLNRDSTRCSEAAMKYLVLGAVASGMLLYGMSLIYGLTGSLNVIEISHAIVRDGADLPMVVAVAFVVVGLAFKLGAVPFHMWLPDVYEGAPTAITAYLSAAPKLAGFALFVRLLAEGLGPVTAEWQQMLMVLAVLSLFLGNVVAIAQTSFKRMLAYSTISHIGFVLLGLLAGTNDGYSAALFYVVAYALMSLGGFATILYLARRGTEAESLDDLRGLNDRNPFAAFTVLILMFSMAGIPFTLGFWAKLAVLRALVQVDFVWLAVFAVVMSVIGAFYYLRVLKMVYFDKPVETAPLARGLDFRLVFGANGLAILGLGLYPAGLVALCAGAINV